MSLALQDYDYSLPEELIASRPLPNRQDSRMMVLRRREESIEHRQFADLPEFLLSDDLLVLNNTRVVNARRFSDDGKIEFLFLERQGLTRWKCLVRPGRKMRPGAQTLINGVELRVEETCPGGERIVSFERELDPWSGGEVPLPPYLRRPADAQDFERYQTVYAERPGAVAAPTAGLHFTSEMLATLPHAFVTLHVGTGTFLPVKVDDISEHRMHSESFSISGVSSSAINSARRIVAVGTTTVRVLEAAERDPNGHLLPQEGATDIFIHPPMKVRQVDALLTNFHLPCSTLLMLVSAFAGRQFVLKAYAEAIRERYRFYS